MFFHGLLHMNIPMLANQQGHISALCRLDVVGGPAKSNGWQKWKEGERERKKESQGILCCQWDLMMIELIQIFLCMT